MTKKEFESLVSGEEVTITSQGKRTGMKGIVLATKEENDILQIRVQFEDGSANWYKHTSVAKQLPSSYCETLIDAMNTQADNLADQGEAINPLITIVPDKPKAAKPEKVKNRSMFSKLFGKKEKTE